jgi:hypothetical protein
MGGAASLLEIDPRLASLLGPFEAAAVGHRPVARVVAVEPGPWTPPSRAELGEGTLALVVLDGLLLGDAPARVLAGPRDRIEPWRAETRWTACTAVHAAVIGEPFVQTVRAWPSVMARLLAGAVRLVPARASTGPAEERLLALLWHLAAHWGRRELEGIVLPLALETGALGLLTELPEADTAAALAALRRRSAASPLDGGGWLLPPGVPAARRDALRTRVTEQLAVARQVQADCNEMCRDLDAQLRETERRRRRAE